MDSPQNDYGFDPNYTPYGGRPQQKPQVMPAPVGGANPAQQWMKEETSGSWMNPMAGMGNVMDAANSSMNSGYSPQQTGNPYEQWIQGERMTPNPYVGNALRQAGAFNQPQQQPNLPPFPQQTRQLTSAEQNNPLMQYLSKMASQKAF